MNKKLITFSIAITAFSFCRAQSLNPTVVASQGDYFTSAGGSVSWTLGEIMGETYSSANNKLTQGFQQPKLLVTAVQTIEAVSSVSFFPNPFSYSLIVNVDSKGTIQLFNFIGEKIGTWVLTAGKNEIDLKNLANGMYVANIINSENNSTQSYKITKAE